MAEQDFVVYGFIGFMEVYEVSTQIYQDQL